MSCYRRQLRIRDKSSDMRWNSKTVKAIPIQWSDFESDHQILYRELDRNDTRNRRADAGTGSVWNARICRWLCWQFTG